MNGYFGRVIIKYHKIVYDKVRLSYSQFELVLRRGKREDTEYVKKNFQYSILENYNSKVDSDEILERESWWKETLQTRNFGYNRN